MAIFPKRLAEKFYSIVHMVIFGANKKAIGVWSLLSDLYGHIGRSTPWHVFLKSSEQISLYKVYYYFAPFCSTIQFVEQNFASWCIKIMSFKFTPSDRCQFFAPVFHEKVVTKNAVCGTGSFCLLRGLCLCLDTFFTPSFPFDE